ncbi:hypothetical protein AB6A40_007764 [Gnathostoma spinigerum]|uniref:Pre-rRNA-processing protein Ipi1 N-terminal domain-containing protein n=1 Tax=Gnathostoma spinigerum TaxID=75299 RepID=A0ABD6ENE1_9BILA
MAKKKKVKDFPKVKIKVGKKLKRTNSTDTRVKAKKLILIKQFSERKGELSHRGLNFDDLCRQLGHFNANVRKDALIGTRQLLQTYPQLISQRLRDLIPAVARLISESKNDSSSRAQLRALLKTICDVPADRLSSYFALFMAHILHGLTHLQMTVRTFAVSILSMVMKRHPDLCLSSTDLFSSYLALLSSRRRPPNNEMMLESLLLFSLVYVRSEKQTKGPRHVATLSFSSAKVSKICLLPSKPPFDFPVLGNHLLQLESPLDSEDGLIKYVQSVFSFLLDVFSSESYCQSETAAKIVELVVQAVDKTRKKVCSKELNAKLPSCFPIKSVIEKRRASKRLRAAVNAMQWNQ